MPPASLSPILAGPKKGGKIQPDVVIRTVRTPAKGAGTKASLSCTISNSALAALKSRADSYLTRGISIGFKDFPIDKTAFKQSILNRFITKKNVCAAFTTPSGATSANHNALRNRFKGDALDESNAASRGVMAGRTSTVTSCPAGYAWKSSPVYNDVDSCSDVTSLITAGVPTAIYALPMTPRTAKFYLTHSRAPLLYSRYSNGGPIPCDGSTSWVSDSYHSLYVSSVWSDLEFIMRTWKMKEGSAWNLRRSCAVRRKVYSYDDLVFDFGMRLYLPVPIEIDGSFTTHTLVIGAVAAASNSWAAGLLPKDLPYHRWIAGEFSKKLLAEAWLKGWSVR